VNVVAVMIAMLYSFYALYASGKDAVFGGMIVMAIGYLIYGFIAYRFIGQETSPKVSVYPAQPEIAQATPHAAQ
jgi:putrescine:ornithine antiporter